jgi:hypothetical protein
VYTYIVYKYRNSLKDKKVYSNKHQIYLHIYILVTQKTKTTYYLQINANWTTTGLFPHDNFSSVYWIFTKLDCMIALWKGKNPIYFGVIRSKVTITINRILYHLIIYIDGHILWCTHFLLSNPTHQRTREMCLIVQDVRIFRFYFS